MKNFDQDFCSFAFQRFSPPKCFLGNSASSSSSSSSTHTETGTTSGSSSPVATGGSQSIGSGSIGVGPNGEYLEQGAINSAGSKTTTTVTAGANSTVITGDPDADAVIESLANDFSGVASTIAGVPGAGSGGGGTTTILPSQPGGSINYTTLGVWVTIIACVLGLLAFLNKKGKL